MPTSQQSDAGSSPGQRWNNSTPEASVGSDHDYHRADQGFGDIVLLHDPGAHLEIIQSGFQA